jgi:MFS transporter, putative metabolite transport protein
VRGSAVGLASALTRIGAAVGTCLVPLALTGWGIGGTMLAAAAITLLAASVLVVWAPEIRWSRSAPPGACAENRGN